jgi:hypothetical protein
MFSLSGIDVQSTSKAFHLTDCKALPSSQPNDDSGGSGCFSQLAISDECMSQVENGRNTSKITGGPQMFLMFMTASDLAEAQIRCQNNI